jgi:hypothetical protein
MALAMIASIFTGCQEKKEERNLVLLVVFDGLRHDYITPEIMPNMYQLKTNGAYGPVHHSIFPTLTRVNSAGIASGAYPATNGVMGNSVYFPLIDSIRGLNTGEASELMRIEKETNGQLFTSPTLAEILRDNGKNLMVFSTGSTGQSFLLNHLAASFGAIVNPQLILPATLQPELEEVAGAIPASGKGEYQRHTWIADAYMHYGLSADAPAVSILWFADPDATAHAKGVGAPETIESIKYADNELGRIISAIRDRGFKVDILISTDHGFITHMGKNSISPFLVEQGLKQSPVSTDVIVVGGAIYVKEKEKVEAIANALMEQHWVGAVFTKPAGADMTEGIIKGTFSMALAHYDHNDRSPDILVDMAWNDDVNEFGYPGKSYSRGIAGHGGSSPYEMNISMVAFGPGFKTSYQSNMASGNVDLAPTILELVGLEIPKEMDGRVLSELFSKTKGEPGLSVDTIYKVSNAVRSQELRAVNSGGSWYLSSTRFDFAEK